MGTTSSQPVPPGFGEVSDEDNERKSLDYHSNVTTPTANEKSDSQKKHTPKSKRKRKSSPNTIVSPPQLPVALVSTTSLPQDEKNTRPSKRKRTSQSAQKKDDRETINERELEKTDKKHAVVEVADSQPSQEPARSPAPSSKLPSKPKAQSVQKSRKKSTPAPQSSTNGSRATSQSVPPESNTDTSTPAKQPNQANENGKKAGLTGFFTSDEVQALESFKLKFCNTHLLSADTFDRMVQHSERDKGSPFPCDTEVITKQEFWRQIYEIIPNRDRRSVYRFMRRHFQASTQKPHQWDHDQDEELIALHTRHGPKWAYIAKLIGRSDDDVVQRWKNRLQHRTTMRRGPWSAEEVRALQDVLDDSRKALAKAGHDVGKDIYEMDETLIGWGHVSDRIHNWRSRQQCADKWRKIRRKVLTLRNNGKPDAIYNPTSELQSPKKPKQKAPAVLAAAQSQATNRYKSSEYVDSDDSEEEGGKGDNSRVVPQPPEKSPSKQPKSIEKGKKSSGAAVQPAASLKKANKKPMIDDSKSTSDAASESESESESKAGSDSETDSGSASSSNDDSDGKQAQVNKKKTQNKKAEAGKEKGKEPNNKATKSKATNGIDSESISKKSKGVQKEDPKTKEPKSKGKIQSKDKKRSVVEESVTPKKPKQAALKRKSPVTSDSDSEDSTGSETEQPVRKQTKTSASSKPTQKAPKKSKKASQNKDSDKDGSSKSSSDEESSSSGEEAESTASSSDSDDEQPTKTKTSAEKKSPPAATAKKQQTNRDAASKSTRKVLQQSSSEEPSSSSAKSNNDTTDSSTSSEDENVESSSSESEADTKPNTVTSRQTPNVKSRQSSSSDPTSTSSSARSSSLRQVKAAEGASDSEFDVKPQINSKRESNGLDETPSQVKREEHGISDDEENEQETDSDSESNKSDSEDVRVKKYDSEDESD